MVIKDCDDYLDGLGDEMKRKDFADYILAVLFSEADQQFENAEFSAVRNHIATFDDKRKRRAKIDGKLLFYATEKVKNASNPKEYSKYVAVEGALTMEFLISLLLVSEAQEDDLHKFKRWSKKGVAMGNLFDSLIDLKADKKNGLFKELPFLNTALKLTRDIVLYLVRVLPHIPKKFLFQLIYGNFKAILIKK